MAILDLNASVSVAISEVAPTLKRAATADSLAKNESPTKKTDKENTDADPAAPETAVEPVTMTEPAALAAAAPEVSRRASTTTFEAFEKPIIFFERNSP